MQKPLMLMAALPVGALAVVSLMASGGGCDACSGTYNCPAGFSEVLLPDGLTSPVATVTATAPCTVSSQPPFTDRSIAIEIVGERTGSCVVHATLADGTELAATLEYAPLMCCDSSSAPEQTFAPVSP